MELQERPALRDLQGGMAPTASPAATARQARAGQLDKLGLRDRRCVVVWIVVCVGGHVRRVLKFVDETR